MLTFPLAGTYGQLAGPGAVPDAAMDRRRLDPLVERLLKGEKSALARVISRIENRDPQAVALLNDIFPHQKSAPRIGVTGPPGAGKSTLVSALVRRMRAHDLRVGVVAVDPTSP